MLLNFTFGKFTPLNRRSVLCHWPSLASTKTFALKLAEIQAILFYGNHRLLCAIITCYCLKKQLSLKNIHNITFSSTSHDDLILLRHVSEVIS